MGWGVPFLGLDLAIGEELAVVCWVCGCVDVRMMDEILNGWWKLIPKPMYALIRLVV